ncbi:MAG: hypothetical protein NPIRA03_20470 [Nitrospirales bacterium]|nr:MAG: hypothetical protein NPIRA03_20470 [Nitrospirales bacterium]
MNRLTLLGLSVVCAFGLVASLSGCGESEGPAEKAGKTLDQAVETTTESVNDAMESTGEAMDNAAEETGEALNEAMESTENMAEDTAK